MNIEINYNYKFYLWGIAKPHRLWSMKLHVSSPTSEPPTIVRSNKHGDVMGLSWGYDDSGCGIYIYISILLELGQYGSIGGWFTTNKHYTKSLLTTYHGGVHSCWWTPTWFWNTSTNHSGPLQKDTYSEPLKMTNFEFRIHLWKSLKKYMMFAMWGTQDRFLLLYCISISVRFTVDKYWCLVLYFFSVVESRNISQQTQISIPDFAAYFSP